MKFSRSSMSLPAMKQVVASQMRDWDQSSWGCYRSSATMVCFDGRQTSWTSYVRPRPGTIVWSLRSTIEHYGFGLDWKYWPPQALIRQRLRRNL